MHRFFWNDGWWFHIIIPNTDMGYFSKLHSAININLSYRDINSAQFTTWQKSITDSKQIPTDLLRLSSSTLPSVATTPSTSFVNDRWEVWVSWCIFSWHKIPAADFSCRRICLVVSSSLGLEEWASFSVFGCVEEWYLPRVTGREKHL